MPELEPESALASEPEWATASEQEWALAQGLDRLMIETDAPYLVPRDLKPRPKRNEPAFLPHIAQVVAACRGEAPEALLAHTRATSAAFFQLPLLE